MKNNCSKKMKEVYEDEKLLLIDMNDTVPPPNSKGLKIPSIWMDYFEVCSDYISLEILDLDVLRNIKRYYEGSASYYSIAVWLIGIIEKKHGVSILYHDKFFNCVNAYLYWSFGAPEDESNDLIKMIKRKNGIYDKGNGKNFDLEQNVLNIDYKKLSKIQNVKVIVSKENKDVELKDYTMGKNKQSKETNKNDKLSEEAKIYLGICGEAVAYSQLINHNKELLNALGIKAYDIEEIVWYNNDYDKNNKMWQDKSVGIGYDIKIKLKNRTIHCEVKTSFNNISYYTLTRNEVIASKKYGEDYFIIKFTNIKAYNDCSEEASIIVIKNPFDRFIKNIGIIKEISLYI